MKVSLLLLITLAVVGASYGMKLERLENVLRELRDFEEFEELARRKAERLCSSEADVVFIIDRSRSIYPPDFEKGKMFLEAVVKLFSPSLSRFAAISFAEGATIEFGLGKFGTNQAATINAIQGIEMRPEIGGVTETWAALETLYKTVLAPNNLRHGVTPTVLLITDGASQESEHTANEAAKAHAKGIKIIAIGVGTAPKMSELNAIASDPDSQNVHMVDNYREALDSIKNTVASQICPSNIENCEHNKPLDVMFSVSEHANAKETKQTFSLLTDVMKKATIGPGNIQFGLAKRDCSETWNTIALDELDSVAGYQDSFSDRLASFSNGLAGRFSYLSGHAFRQGDQPNGNNVAVIFIDRKSDIDETVLNQAKRMNGVHVILVIGGDVTASDVNGIGDAIISFESYDEIMSITDEVLRKLCEALGRP